MTDRKIRVKANKLSTNKQILIAEKYLESQKTDSKLSAKDVANLFTEGASVVTRNQVMNYVRKYKSGVYTRGRKNRTDKNIADAAKLVLEDNPDVDLMISEAISNLIAKIKVDENMNSTAQAEILKEVMTLREKQQRISLERHVKQIDAKFLWELCRYFKPGCTEQSAIEIIVSVRNNMKRTV